MGKGVFRVKIGAAKVVASFTAMWSAFAPMIIVSAIVAIIGKFKSMYDEAQRIKGLFSEYKKGAQSIGSTAEISALNSQLKIMNDKKQSQENINNAQGQLQKMLNVEHKSQKELNDLVAKRVSLLENSAKVDYYTRKKLEAQDRYNELNGEHSKLKAKTMHGGFISRLWNGSNVGDMKKEMNELLRIIADSSKEIGLATVEANNSSTPLTTQKDDKKEKKTPLEKEQASFDKQFAELGAELEIGKLTQSEYNKALAELNIKMYAQAKGTGDKEVLESDYLKARKAAAEAAVKSMPDLKAKVELEKIEKEYVDARTSAKAKLEKGLIAEDAYREAIIDAAVKAAESAVSIEGVGKAADEFIDKMRNVAINNIAAPVLKRRDTTFDYKATDVDKAEGNLDAMKKYADELKDKIKEGAKYLEEEYSKAIANVDTLEEALKLAQVKEDVKNFGKELNGSLYSGIKDVAGSADRVVGAFQNLKDVMSDVDATGWEKIMAIWNTMVNAVDSFTSIMRTIENVSELTSKLAGAKEKQTSLEEGVTGTVLTTGVQIAANQMATEMEVATSQRKTEAATTEMAAKSTAAYASIPFGGVALAAGQIAAMMGMIEASKAAVPKFTNGGIYTGGTASGDKGLARLNKGEMILNSGQQSNLFAAINSGRLGSNQNINIGFDRVRGADILLAVNNTLKRQGKKPI